MKTITLFKLRLIERIILAGLFVAFANTINAQTDWQVLLDSSSNNFIATSFISDNEGWLMDDQSVLIHTSNGGEKWDTTFKGTQFSKIDFIDQLNGFALLSYSAAYKTIDGGHSWVSLELPGKIGASIYFQNKNIGFISGKQAIYKTADGGATWKTIALEKIYFHDYYFINETFGIVATNDHDGYRSIWKTKDGGDTWNNVFNQTDYYIHSVLFINESIGWAVGYFDLHGVKHEPTILQTTDAGETWKVVYHNADLVGEGQELLDIHFKNEKEGIAISNLADNVFTTDGGTTWNRTYDSETLDLPPYGGIYSTLDGFDVMFIGGSDGHLVKWK
jgi:photosystem II stability/assembly factor-like uncharacterized protein